jgi:hypothetical protein
MFLNGLNDDVQFQLLNTDYANLKHMVNKAIVVENKIKEMEKDGKRKPPFLGQSSGSNVRPHLSQPSQFFQPLQMNRSQVPLQMQHPQYPGHNSRCRDQMFLCSDCRNSQTDRMCSHHSPKNRHSHSIRQPRLRRRP